MAKTVAQLAAEQGLDEQRLVQTLRLLARRRTVRAHWNHTEDRWIGAKPLFTDVEAAALLGLSEKEVTQKLMPPPEWTQARVLDALFAFYKQHQRWPRSKDWRNANSLPSEWKLGRLTNPNWTPWRNRGQAWRLPWGHFQRLVAKDKRCTAEMAFRLSNALARKEAIERIGFDKLIKQLGPDAQIVDSHEEFGTLYSLPGETPSERMLLVKVVNSTPEPDGSFADYFLRVPPEMSNVQEALAWTFNLAETVEYRPLIET